MIEWRRLQLQLSDIPAGSISPGTFSDRGECASLWL